MVLVVDERAVADRRRTRRRSVGSAGRDDAFDELVVAAAVGDQVGDRDHLQAVPRAVLGQVRHARHRAVVVHHLADHAGRVQPGEPREVDRRLGLAGALEHAAGRGLEREHVAGLDEVARRALGVDRDLDRVRAVVRGDPGGDALARLDRDRERGLEGDSFFAAIRSSPSSSQRSGVSDRQISPRASLAMKLIASGVANCAAIVRSPSFSRSSSSQTTTILPVADVLERLLDRGERAPCGCSCGACSDPAP